jgi:hypothetical protein
VTNRGAPPARNSRFLIGVMGYANVNRADSSEAMEALRRKNRPDPDLQTILDLVPADGSRIEIDDLALRSPFNARKTHLLLSQLICDQRIRLHKDRLSNTTWLRRAPPKEP